MMKSEDEAPSLQDCSQATMMAPTASWHSWNPSHNKACPFSFWRTTSPWQMSTTLEI